MSPEQKIEQLRDRMLRREEEEDRRIVQFEVCDYYIYVLLADGTLWRQGSAEGWMKIKGP